MSRDGGFEVGDRSTRTLYDTRLVRAYRIAGLAAVVAWDAIVDESWAKGQRVTIEDALLPLPYEIDAGAVSAALQTVGLLDNAGYIREDSWDTWFAPAHARREAKRERDRAYAKKAAAVRWDASSDTLPSRERVVSESLGTRMPPSVRPSVRTDRLSVLRAPAREGEAPSKDGFTTVRETATALGFHPVPKPPPSSRRKP